MKFSLLEFFCETAAIVFTLLPPDHKFIFGINLFCGFKTKVPDIFSLMITETMLGIGILCCINDLALCSRSLVVNSAD